MLPIDAEVMQDLQVGPFFCFTLDCQNMLTQKKKKKTIERIRITKVWKMKQTLNLRNKRFKRTPPRYDLFFCSVHFRQKKHVTIVEEEEIVFLASFIFCIPSFYFFFIIYTSFLIMCQTLFFLLISSYIFLFFSIVREW